MSITAFAFWYYFNNYLIIL